ATAALGSAPPPAGKEGVSAVRSPGLLWRVPAHEQGVKAVAFCPVGKRLASGGLDGRVRLWEVEGGRELAGWDAHPGGVLCLAFAPDGQRVLSGGVDRALR